jgi:hypothetical protein
MSIDRDHVLRRLCDARDWARYVHDTLTLDEAHEPGKQALLEAMTAPEELRALQAESRALADRLRLLADRLLSVQVG